MKAASPLKPPVLAFLLLAAMASPSHSQDVDICPTLKAVVQSAEDEFATLKGRETDRDEWEARAAMPRATSCDISRFDGSTTYFCSWRLAEESAARRMGEGLASAFSSCLGRTMRETPGRNSSRRKVHFYSTLSLPSDKHDHISVTILASTRTVGPRAVVITDVTTMVSAEKD